MALGVGLFPFCIVFKYDFSAKLIETSCFTANAHVALLMPLIGQSTDMTVSEFLWK